MPRSALLRMLQRAARDDTHAEQADRRLPGRRAVLRGGIGIAATALLPATGLAATAKIAVVGAGLAGLTAAYELRKANYECDVFEGSTRIGGRCFSASSTFSDGQVAEHGGEFIDTGHHEIRSLAKELGLTLDDVLKDIPPDLHERYVIGGKPYDLKDATRDWNSGSPSLRTIVDDQAKEVGTFDYRHSTPAARRFDAMTISAWIASFVPSGRTGQLGQLIETAFTEENGADADQQSALDVISVLAGPRNQRDFNLYYFASDQRFHVHGGNDQIPKLLADKLGARVMTAMPLTAIVRLPDGRIRLSLKRGSGTIDRDYDRVILALPFSVMRSMVDYRNAGFRALKMRAIQTLPMGASTKFQMQFSRRAWIDIGCNGEMRVPSQLFQTTWEVSRKQAGERGILNFFSGGTRALNAGKMDSVTMATTVMKDLGGLMPGLGQLWTGLMIKDAWNSNPWSLGSYSYPNPGYLTSLSGIEREPEGNCFFAGEHTAEETSFLNSAVASGQRAAIEVIKSL